MSLTKHDWMLAWVNLIHAGTYMASSLDGHFRDNLGISLQEQDLLNQLGKVGGEVMLSELARRLYLSKAGMTKMIDRLEKDGLLERVRPGPDRRVLSARLTTRGRSVMQRSRRILEAWVEENFRAHLSDRQVISLRDGLRTLLEGQGRWEGQMKHLRGEPHEP